MTAMFNSDHDYVRIAELCLSLGVPQDDWVLFWRWADELPDGKAVDELNSYVDVLVAQRCIRPTDDLTSELVALDMTVDEIHTEVAALVAKPDRKLSPYRPSRA